MKYVKLHGAFPPICLLIAILLCSSVCDGAAAVREYRIFPAELYTKEKQLARIALRKFKIDGVESYLAVDPATLATEIVPVGRYLVLQKPMKKIRDQHGGLAYFKVISIAEKNSRRLQNAGIVRIAIKEPVAYITADLCPTKLPMDRTFFTRLMSDYGIYRRPVPLGVAVSGRWLEKHSADLMWLRELERRNDIDVVWINHSFTHRHKKRIPLWRNFLLDGDNNIEEEVTRNESAMITAGLVPSVFFRFPGLVSSKDIVSKVIDFGLVPLGSDAWLGKKEWPVPGSIILVHANGQEPVGIKRFAHLLQSKKQDIAAGRWLFGNILEGLKDSVKMY